MSLLFAGACLVKVLFEDAFGADVFGVVVAFVDSEVVLPGELGVGVVGVFVFLGFEIADAFA